MATLLLLTAPSAPDRPMPRSTRSLALGLVGAAMLSGTASAHITLQAPLGGEVFSVGETTPIQWLITVQHALTNWDLEYSVSGPMGPWIPIVTDLAPGDPSSGSIHVYDWVVPDALSTQVRVRVIMDNMGMDYEAKSLSDITILPCAAPVAYCTSAPNSVGAGSMIGWTGTPNVSTNGLSLTANNLPPNKPGLFFYGPNQISVPFGEGVRCVGGNLSRLSVLLTDGAGQANQMLDVTNVPSPILAGSQHNFQLWYRDPVGGPSGFNLSDGLSVTFCP